MKIVKSVLEVVLTIFFKVLFLFVKKENDTNLIKTINLYQSDGFGKLFAQIRAWDAPYAPIDKLISKNAKVLDLGSGDGLLANYLALSSPRRKVQGIELNKGRAKVAYKGLKNTSFKQGNILKANIPSVNVIILAHVLHHLPGKEDQIALLAKISKRLKKGQDLVILEIDYKPFSKYIFSWLTDAITVPVLFEGKLFTTAFYYRKSAEWKKVLSELGFRVKIKPIHRGMPFSHILIYAKKVAN